MRLHVENLACSRGERRIFEGLSFALAPGDALIVLGRNGAGKSSLLDILAGKLAPAGGTLAVSEAGDRTLPECLHHIGHRDALKAALSAEENLAFARDFLGSPALAPQEALAVLGLGHAARLPVAYLSAGQRRRVALARLLVAHRPLWLLDEPTAALDGASQDNLHRLIAEHRQRGGIVVATTHQPLALGDTKSIRIERPAAPSTSDQTLLEGEGA